jgi:tetratricopeptide (TPR) repeat protein
LAQKHLLRPFNAEVQSVRVEMLEVIRDYARSQFDSFEFAYAYERAFALYVREVIANATREHASAGYRSWLDLIASEYLNVCAALRWCVEQDRPLGLRLALSLTEYWERKGLQADARKWLETLTDPLEETLKGEEPLFWWRVVTALALSCYWTADNQRACALHRRTLAIARSLDDPVAIAKSLNNLGIALLAMGEAREARNALEEALAIKEQRSDAWSLGSTVANLGDALGACNDYEGALQYHQRAHNLFRSVGDQWGEIGELNNIGDLHLRRRDYREAAACYVASLEANGEGIRIEAVHSLEGLVAIAASKRSYRRVALLAGTVTRMHGETGRTLSQFAAAKFATACATARASLGNSLFEETSKTGTEMSLVDAIEIARKTVASSVEVTTR